MNTTILLVDDHEILRAGIRDLLKAKRPRWKICGEVTSGEEAIEAVRTLDPDVVILDMSMPGMSGIETTREIRRLGLDPHVVMFTMHDSDSIANEARLAGAQGYVRKSRAGSDLIQAIEVVLLGKTFFHTSSDEDR
jgi:DNA-binding NarL/FixJ family response regulator